MLPFRDFLLEDETLTDDPPVPPKLNSWGFHMMIDMSSCNKKMDDEDDVRAFFDVLIQILDMKKLSSITIKRVDSEEGRGLSAVQLITTSSITFHGDDVNKCVYLDVFSCKDFDRPKVLSLVQKYFTPKRISHKFIYRDAGPAASEDGAN